MFVSQFAWSVSKSIFCHYFDGKSEKFTQNGEHEAENLVRVFTVVNHYGWLARSVLVGINCKKNLFKITDRLAHLKEMAWSVATAKNKSEKPLTTVLVLIRISVFF